MTKYLIEPRDKKSVQEIIQWWKDEHGETQVTQVIWWRFGTHIIESDSEPDFSDNNEDGIEVSALPNSEMHSLSDEVETLYYADSDLDEELDENDHSLQDFLKSYDSDSFDESGWEAVSQTIYYYGPIKVSPYKGD